MATVTELVTKFTFKGALTPLTEFNAGLKKSIGLLSASAIAIKASVAAFAYFTIETNKSIGVLNNLSNQTGIAISQIQALGYAASVSGSDAQTLEGALSSLTSKIGQATISGSEDFARLGISIRDSFGNIKKADTVLLEVGQRFKELGLSLPQQQSLAQSLGIDASLIRLLNTSNSELDKLLKKAKALGTLSKEDATKVEAFNNSITALKYGFNSLQNKIAIGLSPQIKRIAEQFTAFLETNKELITKGLEKTFAIIETVSKSINTLIETVNRIVQATIGWKGVLIGLATAFAFLNPITTLIAGILLIVDDLIVAFKGGKSVIRDFFNEFLGIDITPIMKRLVQAAKDAFSVIGAIFRDIYKLFTNPVKFIMEESETGKWARSQDWSLGAATKDFNSVAADATINSPLNRQTVNNASSSSNQSNYITQNIKFDIKSNDAGQVALKVSDTLQNQLQNTIAQTPVGGR